jgi:hypothetical protein
VSNLNLPQLTHYGGRRSLTLPVLLARDNELFKGRRDIIFAIEERIINTGQRPALLLYGRRRMGKTSTLQRDFGKTRRSVPLHHRAIPPVDIERSVGV